MSDNSGSSGTSSGGSNTSSGTHRSEECPMEEYLLNLLSNTKFCSIAFEANRSDIIGEMISIGREIQQSESKKSTHGKFE
ncbi:hypothetical protein L596_023812 [Steinernema carpocapsae]|uniref:Uncharacterized protein n=1 Tax=Steinernema carpocapsae TaxID=34508 RepID=A0A4U5MFJ6_STECR|nr:hypothetical protein L596_023812 [Steinernema carpocapsae]